MRWLRRTLLVLVLALTGGGLVGTPAHAVTYTTWLNGTLVSGVVGDTYSFLGDVQRTSCTWRSYAVVTYSADRVYIRDDCSDGIPATAWVQWRSGGHTYHYYCVNNHGAGTYAMCDLNWPEGGSTVKMFVAGLKSASTVPGQWQWGNWSAIYD
jgi:hypothetical protein